MECYLDIRLAELDLLVAARCTLVQDSRIGFFRERTLGMSKLHLVKEFRLGPHIEPVLLHGKVFVTPHELAEVVEDRALRKMDITGSRQDVKNARKAWSAVLHYVFIPFLRLRC